jgi:hypothetical protein
VSHFSNPGTISYINSNGVDFISFDRGDNRTWMLVNTAPTPTTATVQWLGTQATITNKFGQSTTQTFPGLVNGKAPPLSISLAGASNGIVGSDPIIIDQTNIGGSIEISPEQLYFPVSGHAVANAVLDYWRANGGIKHFGPPTSDEAKQPDRIVQTFANATIEIFPQFAGTDFYAQEGTGKASPTSAAKPSTVPGNQYFSQTGHNLAFAFLKAYKAFGGTDVLGFPRTEAMSYQGQTVQFFQRGVMEYHAEAAGTPGEVVLRLVGSDLTQGRAFPSNPPGKDDPTHHFFPETGYTMANAFLKFYNAHGGAAVLGLPISEEMPDLLPDGAIHEVQYTQRGRMEYHPELAGKPGEVSLGLVGDELLAKMGWL